MVRCKMVCRSKTVDANGDAQIEMNVVYTGSPENEQFFKYTPFGEFRFGTVNAEAAKQIEQGKEYYIDISPATQCEPANAGSFKAATSGTPTCQGSSGKTCLDSED